MRVDTFADRRGRNYFFDMTLRLCLQGDIDYPGQQYHRGGHDARGLPNLTIHGFRIGDRLAVRQLLYWWRLEHPDDRLVVTDDPYLPLTSAGGALEAWWLLPDVADEVRTAEYSGELIPLPPGAFLPQIHRWDQMWRGAVADFPAYAARPLAPLLAPKPGPAAEARRKLAARGVPERYVTVDILAFSDRPYQTCYPAETWQALITALDDLPVVVIGAPGSPHPAGGRAHVLFDDDWCPQQSMEVIRTSACHVGADTGMSWWAAACGVPTVQVYPYAERRWGTEIALNSAALTVGVDAAAPRSKLCSRVRYHVDRGLSGARGRALAQDRWVDRGWSCHVQYAGGAPNSRISGVC